MPAGRSQGIYFSGTTPRNFLLLSPNPTHCQSRFLTKTLKTLLINKLNFIYFLEINFFLHLTLEKNSVQRLFN
jgi:hypothetical protein